MIVNFLLLLCFKCFHVTNLLEHVIEVEDSAISHNHALHLTPKVLVALQRQVRWQTFEIDDGSLLLLLASEITSLFKHVLARLFRQLYDVSLPLVFLQQWLVLFNEFVFDGGEASQESILVGDKGRVLAVEHPLHVLLLRSSGARDIFREVDAAPNFSRRQNAILRPRCRLAEQAQTPAASH